MRLCTYDPGDGEPRAGIVVSSAPEGIAGGEAGARVLEIGALAGRKIRDLGQLVEMHPHLAPATLCSRLASAAAQAGERGAPLAEVRLLAPVLRPPKVTCVGLNYKDHAAEQKAALPERPLLFAKARTAVIGPRDAVRIPEGSEKVDYEVELCLVVGRGGFRIPREKAREHLLGYTVACDVSDRGAQYGDKQWYRGKSFPTFCPTGPVVATADATDPSALRLTTRLNGKVMQDGTTADLIFGVDALIEYISRQIPLEPGDLVLTGTPAGVGVFRDPPVFLRPGDDLECAIHGIGALRLRIEAAPAAADLPADEDGSAD